MAKRIVVDAGHGGYDNGASYQGRLEKEDNLRLALQVGEDLKKLGYDVNGVSAKDFSPLIVNNYLRECAAITQYFCTGRI